MPPSAYFDYSSHNDLSSTRLCFKQKGSPNYRLSLNERTLGQASDITRSSSCHNPFQHYTTDQLQQLAGLQTDQLTLTVSPL